MELTGNKDRTQFDKFMWERKEKSGRPGNHSGGSFPLLYKPSWRVHQQRRLVKAEQRRGGKDYVDAQEKF
jgi:hypothetical protein